VCVCGVGEGVRAVGECGVDDNSHCVCGALCVCVVRCVCVYGSVRVHATVHCVHITVHGANNRQV